jgi:hypothetical protein
MAYDNAPKKKFAEDYIDVAERLRAWYEAYPNARIETSIVSHTDSRVTVKALAFRGDTSDPDVSGRPRPYGFEERPAGVGHSSMAIPGSTPYTRGSELENTETSAVGRALVMAGLPSKKVASGDEIRAKGGTTIKPSPAMQEREKQKVDDEAILRAAQSNFSEDAALLDWRDAISGAGNATELAAVAQQIAASQLDADQKRYLGQYYTARKSEIGA